MLNWLLGRRNKTAVIPNMTNNSSAVGLDHPLIKRLIAIGAPITEDTKTSLYAALGAAHFVKTAVVQTSIEQDYRLTGVILLVCTNHFCRVLHYDNFEISASVAFLEAFGPEKGKEILPFSIQVYNHYSEQKSPMLSDFGGMIARWSGTGSDEIQAEIASLYEALVRGANSKEDPK
jgi:hypothetical protein